MTYITQAHPKTHEILANARAALEAGEQADYNEIVLSCFKAEAAIQILSSYAEAL
jgi:hypothetical protein